MGDACGGIWIGAGNGDFEFAGMEHEAGFRIRVVAIDWVAENRDAEIFEVDAELVSATGGRFKLKEGVLWMIIVVRAIAAIWAVVDGEDFVISLGRFAVLVDLESGRAFEIAGDRQVDHGFVEFWSTFDDGVIGFVSFAVLELFAEHGLGFGVFGENNNAAGVAVEAVNEQAIVFESGFGTVFALRHAEEAGRLIDNKNVLVFIDNRRARREFCGGGDIECNFGGFFELGVGFGGDGAVDGDIAGFDEFLETGAVVLGVLFDEEVVETELLGGLLVFG